MGRKSRSAFSRRSFSAIRTSLPRGVPWMPRPGVRRGPEVKFYSASSGLVGVYDSNAGAVVVDLVSGITQGLTDNQRVGDVVQLTSAKIFLNFLNGTGLGSNVNTTYRAMVIQWKNDSSVLPTLTNLLLASSMNGGVTSGAFSFPNIDYYDRQATVLFDSGPTIHTVGSVSLAATGSAGGSGILAVRSHTVSLKKCDRRIQFTAAGATGTNHLMLVITTDQAHNAAVEPLVSYGWQVRFTDS